MTRFHPKVTAQKRMLLLIIFLSGTNFAHSQSCSVSEGDPIVQVTFGAGSFFGPPLPANTTSLGYVASACPPDGNYSIVNYTSGCFGNDVVWHTTVDHTGNPDGYFMLVNASYQPGDFYIQTISGLCSGTSYRFAAWMINMCSVTGGFPNITFTIEKADGSILATYNTGDIPIINPAAWKQYGFNFTMPPNVSTVVLRMRNNAPGGVGNDVGLDDITFRPVGPAVAVNGVNISGDTLSYCTGHLQQIDLESTVANCYFSTAYQWQISTNTGKAWTDIPGADSAGYSFTASGAGTSLYRLAVAQQNNIASNTCRVVSAPFTIHGYPDDVSTIHITSSPATRCIGNVITFSAVTTVAGPAPVYQWRLNGKPAGGNTASFSSSNLVTGDVVNCFFKSSVPCNQDLLSNSIIVSLHPKIDTTVNHSLCQGQNYEGYNTSGTYTDVFNGSNGCDSTRTLYLIVYPSHYSIVDTTICYGTSYEGYYVPGTYSKTYLSANGCDSVKTIHLSVMEDVASQPFKDTLLCAGDSIVLSPGHFDSYLWQDGSTTSSLLVTRSGKYSVRVSNHCGSAVKVTLVNESDCTILFPNAFTPNNDGLNDVFEILNAHHLAYFHCVVFNRLGQKVFESYDPSKGWDGNIKSVHSANGTYAWTCDYTRTGNTGIRHLQGTVTLLR